MDETYSAALHLDNAKFYTLDFNIYNAVIRDEGAQLHALDAELPASYSSRIKKNWLHHW